ncbi:MAG: hypothetical protein IJ057_04470 [Bacteroidales bacterium]|nr:hypothetical protein [Bacteroidales bacterium]
MNTIRKQKKLKSRKRGKLLCLRGWLLMLLLVTGIGYASAATVTLKTQTGGKFRYQVETGAGTGAYGNWSSYLTANSATDLTTTGVKVGAGAVCVVSGSANRDSDCQLIAIKNGDNYVSYGSSYCYTVSADATFAAELANAWNATFSQDTVITIATGDVQWGTGHYFSINADWAHQYECIGKINVTNGANVTIKVQAHLPIYIDVNGMFVVEKGSLNMNLQPHWHVDTIYGDVPYADVILQRFPSSSDYPYDAPLFRMDPAVAGLTNDNVLENCKLSISGYYDTVAGEYHNFVIDGNCHPQMVYSQPDADGNYHDIQMTCDGTEGRSALMQIRGGTLAMDHVTLQNNFNATDGAGGIYVGAYTGVPVRKIKAYIDNCKFENLRTLSHGGALCFNAVDGDHDTGCYGSHMWINNTEFSYCYAKNNDIPTSSCGGGAFRGMAHNYCELDMEDCEIHHCYTDDDGGGFRWNSCLIPPARIKNTKIHDNWCADLGGGARIEGLVEMDGCIITNNRSENDGGGVSMGNFIEGKIEHINASQNDWWDPSDGILNLSGDTRIENNWAGRNGGGLHFMNDFIRFMKSNDDNTVIMRFFLHPVVDEDGNLVTPYGSPFKVAIDLNGATISNNRAEQDGGGVYMERLTNIYGLEANLNYGNIHDNIAGRNGGGIAIVDNLNPNDIYSTFQPGATYVDPFGGNHSVDYTECLKQNFPPEGQPIYVHVGTDSNEIPDDAYMSVYDNMAIEGGGVYMSFGNVGVYGNAKIGIKDHPNEADGNGGGIHVTGDRSSLNMYDGIIAYNEADVNGGGFYVNGGKVEVSGGMITENIAEGDGGGFYVSVAEATSVTKVNSFYSDETFTTISNNHAVNGAGFYVDKGTVQIEGRGCQETMTTNIVGNEASGNGAGLYMANGDVFVTSSIFDSNEAEGNGGGIYVEDGGIVASGAVFYSNKANLENGKGGGMYVGNGNVEVKAASPACSEDPIPSRFGSENPGTGNQACEGGGLYVNDGNVVLSDGKFEANYASQKGGAIYIKEGASLYLREKAEINYNHVPSTGQGGGIYMNGKLYVGDNSSPSTQMMQCSLNYAGESYSLETRNNIYLPSYYKVVTLMSDISTTTTKLGVSVHQGYKPVIEVLNPSTEEEWLYHLMPSATNSMYDGKVFDDARKYIAIHTRTDDNPFQMNYIYFWGCWTTEVVSNPGVDAIELVDGVYHIKTNSGLAWFSSLVNGLNHREGDDSSNPFTEPQSGLDAVLDADVNMDGYLWVPIGAITGYNNQNSSFTETDSQQYQGQFDGQGHIIRNIECGFLTGVKRYGVFGIVGNDGEVKNMFVDDYKLRTTDAEVTYKLGGIAGEVGGTGVVFNSEARGEMNLVKCDGASYSGGIAGYMSGSSSVHSCMAMPLLKANSMAEHIGGLVGELSSGASLKNSYAYPKLNLTTNNVGGLVGVNNGTIENCYVRLQQGSVTTKLKWFAATNGGTIDYCYAPSEATLEGTSTNGNYGLTELVNGKYGFAHEDQQIAPEDANDFVVNGPISDKGELGGLLATLNKWVKAQPATDGYSNWTRTMGSSMNDDYPILEFNDFVTAGSKDDIFLMYKTDLNDMIDYANTDIVYSNLIINVDFEDDMLPPGLLTVNGSANGQWVISEGGSITPQWANPLDYMASEGNSLFYVAENNDNEIVYLISQPIDFDGTVGTMSFDIMTLGSNQNNGMLEVGYSRTGNINDFHHFPNAYSISSSSWSRQNLSLYDYSSNLFGTYYIIFRFTRWIPGVFGIDNIHIQIGEGQTISGGRIFQYRANPTAISTNTASNVRVYIDENVGLTQANGNTLNARVGVTLDNTDGSNLGGQPYDWHMFSSALNEVPMGLVYHTNEEGYEGVSDYSILNHYSNLVANGISQTDYESRMYMDPPKTTWNTTEGQKGYFPTDTPYGTWRSEAATTGSFDFYTFSEPFYHWINFKREGKEGLYDHWHNDATDEGYHNNIAYANESEMQNGKGYLLAVSKPSMLMADGELNNGEMSVNVTCSALEGAQASLKGVNLIGNPYQSYLDADQFMDANGLNVYYILDADARGYIARVRGGSEPAEGENYVKAYNAPAYMHPHQGFFVRVTADKQQLTFANEMRRAEGDEHSNFRGTEVPHYPMVTMICSDGNGMNDFATVELGRPEMGGGEKLKSMRSGDASIWFHMEEKDWHVAFAPEGTMSVAMRFAAYADGVYTLRWQKANADFHYMHLIDNVTGADIDCLRESEYRFEGKTTDYASRFRLVFDYTGVEENEGLAQPQDFAFMMGDELVVTGEGLLQVFDLTGRCLATEELHGAQSRVAMPKAATALYVLRLTNTGSVRTQKLVVR